MLVNFIRDDRYYDFYWKVKVDSKEEVEELLKRFREEVVDDEQIYDSPEYFKAYLEEQGIECEELSSLEVEQVYFGD